MDAAGVLGLLGLLEERVEVGDDHDLLALLLLAAQLVDGGQGGVQVAGAEQVADVEPVDLAVALEVVDLKREADLCGISLSLGLSVSLYSLFELTLHIARVDAKLVSNFFILLELTRGNQRLIGVEISLTFNVLGSKLRL